MRFGLKVPLGVSLPGRPVRPDVTLHAIDGDRHLLRALVDGDEDAGARRRSERYREEGAKQGRGKPTAFRRLARRPFAEKHSDTRRCSDPQDKKSFARLSFKSAGARTDGMANGLEQCPLVPSPRWGEGIGAFGRRS